MITLNLIPESIQKEVKTLDFYISLKNIVFLLLATTAFLSILLLIAKLSLQNYFYNSIANNNLHINVGKYSTSEIKKFNQQITEINKINDQYTQWAQVIAKTSNAAHEGIVFDEIRIDEKRNFFLTGIAKTREDLLLFKDRIDETKIFENFEIPLEIQVKKKNITFELKLKLKKNGYETK